MVAIELVTLLCFYLTVFHTALGKERRPFECSNRESNQASSKTTENSPTMSPSSTWTYETDTTRGGAHSTSPLQVREECYQYQHHATSQLANGVYTIQTSFGTFPVYCNFLDNGGGWTIIQRRVDNSTSFDRDWITYGAGFGDLNSNYWMGLDKIGSICKSRNCELLVVMTDWYGVRETSLYNGFSVEGSNIFISSFASGNAGNSLTVGVPVQFSTIDSDHTNCASSYGGGGWWYPTDCGDSLPNGIYYPLSDNLHSDGIVWRSWRGDMYSLKSIELRVRNTNNV